MRARDPRLLLTLPLEGGYYTLRTHDEKSMIPQDRDRFAPGKLWSLWDIVEDFEIERLILVDIRSNYLFQMGIKPEGNRVAMGSAISGFFELVALVESVPGCPKTKKLIAQSREEFNERTVANQALVSLNAIVNMLHIELKEHKFLMLSEDDCATFEQERGFGDAVYDRFPSARMDIKEAGTCFSLGRYNATIHHSICAAEFGLRALAKDRGITMTYGKVALNQSQWGGILEELDKAIDKITRWPKGDIRDAAAQFYEPCILDAGALNDGYRRHIAHARGKTYEKDEAQSLMQHARRFLQRVAIVAGEDISPTPEIWDCDWTAI